MGTSAEIATKLREGAEHAFGNVVTVAVPRDFLTSAAEILDAADKVDWYYVLRAVTFYTADDQRLADFRDLVDKMHHAGMVR